MTCICESIRKQFLCYLDVNKQSMRLRVARKGLCPFEKSISNCLPF